MKQRIALILAVVAFGAGCQYFCAGKWFSDCEVADVGTLVMTRLVLAAGFR